MKLVEILARKLKEWPEGAVSIAQDDDGRTWAYRGTPDRGTRQWLAYQGETEIDLIGGIEVGDADDRTIAIITRGQWQAERDRIAGVTVSAELQSTDGPLDWRDRIREIDSAIDAEHERHCSAMAAFDSERAELVAKLAAEGLALCDVVNVAAPAEDMSDPGNWQVGDQVEIKASDNPGWVKFKGVTGQLENDGDWWISFPDDGVWYVSNNTTVKWHSRP